MIKNEKFVKSVYPNAEFQASGFSYVEDRVVSEPTINGRWLGKSFEMDATDKWANAAEAVRLEMLKKLES